MYGGGVAAEVVDEVVAMLSTQVVGGCPHRCW